MTQEIGKRFRYIRKQNGITKEQVAHFLGVDESVIRLLESGMCNIELNLLEKVTNLFGCPLEYFTNEEFIFKPMPFALRGKEIQVEDFDTIAIMNKLALNLKYMEEIREELERGE